MVHPPRVGRRPDLRARLERGDQHVDRRRQEEDDEQDQEEIRPEQRSCAGRARCCRSGRGRAGRRAASAVAVRHCHASLPRLRTLRRMKNAAIARIGTMNSDTDAPSGMSLPQIAKVNAQVAKTCV